MTVRFCIEVRPADGVYSYRFLWRVQCLESGFTNPLMRYSDSLDKTATERSHWLLFRTAGPFTVRSATESTVTIVKDGFAVDVSLDRVTKMLRLSGDATPPAKVHTAMGQPDPELPKTGKESSHFLTDLNDPDPAEHAIDRVVEHWGTEVRAEYKLWW